jgi:hypothetical protein
MSLAFFLQQIELTPKRLEFLTEAVPDMARVVVLWDRFSADQFEAAREAARSLKIPLDGIECTDPPYDYESALAGVEWAHRDALLQMASPVFFVDRQRLVAMALDHRLPSIFAFRQWVDEGGLMSYGASLTGSSTPPIAKASTRASPRAFIGVLHADGYAGFNGLFGTGRIIVAPRPERAGTKRMRRKEPFRKLTSSPNLRNSGTWAAAAVILWEVLPQRAEGWSFFG